MIFFLAQPVEAKDLEWLSAVEGKGGLYLLKFLVLYCLSLYYE